MADVVDIPGFPLSCIFLVLCPVDSLQRLTNKQFFNLNETLLNFYPFLSPSMGGGMKIENFVRVFSCFAVACLAAPGRVDAGLLEITSKSSLAYYERDTSAEKNLQVMPFSQYLGVDYITDVEGLSFHGYGWGRLNLGDNNYFQEESDGEFLYGYMEYTLAASDTSMRLGRQHLFAGVANDSLDGFSMRAALGTNFAVSLYGGSPVALENEDGRSGDFIVGGRISNYRSGLYELGVSYKQIRNDATDDNEMLGVDLSLYLPHAIGFNGFSSLNMLTDSWAEHSYELQIPVADFQVRPFLQRFQYDDYFSTSKNSANPFRFLATTGEELTIIGTEVDWFGAQSYEVNLKVKNIDYDLRQDSSTYISGMVIKHLEDTCQVGIELGSMAGNTSDTDYLLGRAFVYWNRLPAAMPMGFISADLVIVGYREDIFGQSSSTFISLGTGRTFLDEALALKFSLDYSKDPYFDNDIRSMLVAEYTFGKAE